MNVRTLALTGALFFARVGVACAQATSSPCVSDGAGHCAPVTNGNPLPVIEQYSSLSRTQLTGNGAGTTGAVVGTLASAAGKTVFICGFNVSAIGGTGAVGPITIAGLITSSMVYQMASTASGNTVGQSFMPCIPASATNTNITTTTTADGTASTVNVNSWGYIQ